VRRILAEAPRYLEPDGNLVVEVGVGGPRLAAERPDLAFTWLDTETSEGEVFWLTAGAFPSAAGTARRPRRRG
jgi:ribosomal protein L3 glutamine methyltransferase